MAKALAFGADLCGMALPLLKPAMEDDTALSAVIERIHRELRVAMFLTGSERIADLKNAPFQVTGKTRQMIENRNPGWIKTIICQSR